MIAVRPRADQKVCPGERLAIECQDDEPDGGLWHLTHETTLPERVARTDADQRRTHSQIAMVASEMLWLCEVYSRTDAQSREAVAIAGLTSRQLRLRHDALLVEMAQARTPVIHRSIALECKAIHRRIEEATDIERELAIRNSAATARHDHHTARIKDLEWALRGILDKTTNLLTVPCFAHAASVLERRPVRSDAGDTVVVDDPDAVTVDGRSAATRSEGR